MDMKTVSPAQFDRWRQNYTFEALKGEKYGQSFCNTFSITDYILMYALEKDKCDKYIKKHYIRSRN